MEQRDDEETLLRSVALQNAQSILLARQRAEEELVRAKEALEWKTQELARSLAMMRATLESTTDGILVTDGGGKVTGFNEKFVAMWRIPREDMDSKADRQLQEVACQYFKDPRQFLARIEDIYASSPPERYDLLELADEGWSSDPQGSSSSMSGTWAASGPFETSRPASRPSGPPTSSPTPAPF
jgi:PAS domain-containing protein